MNASTTTTPKVELHLHLEGAISPSLARKLAARHQMRLPEELFGPRDTYVWNDFLHFLKVFDQISAVVQTVQDYAEITYDYLRRSAEEGVIYVELFISPDHAAISGMSYLDVVQGVSEGIDRAREAHDIEARILIAYIRHFGVEACNAMAKATVANPHPYVVGVGMGGDEINFPPGLFEESYKIAHDAGLGCTVHAGEWGGPESIEEALDTLHVTRLSHGVRAIESDALLQRIIDENITLECAPGSNIALGVYPDYAHHPFLTLYQRGARVTLSSDDPPFFDTSVGQEYDNAQKAFALTDDDLRKISKMAIEASFAETALKEKLLQRLG